MSTGGWTVSNVQPPPTNNQPLKGTTMTITTITAAEVDLGDFLPDLDNGYVVEIRDGHRLTGDYNAAFASEHLLITFHDAEGEHQYLLLTPDHPIRVGRN